MRHHDTDWLCVLGITTMFLFYCARYLDDKDWNVKNNQLGFRMRPR
jgi:hypothetical protein